MSILGKSTINKYSKNKLKLEKDQIVYTSGLGGIFKPGIPIGKLYKNLEDDKYMINFYSDFSQLSYVKIQGYKFEGNN